MRREAEGARLWVCLSISVMLVAELRTLNVLRHHLRRDDLHTEFKGTGLLIQNMIVWVNAYEVYSYVNAFRCLQAPVRYQPSGFFSGLS
jgi:hypothetical protein